MKRREFIAGLSGVAAHDARHAFIVGLILPVPQAK
jgi:hypothetical protein